MEPGFASADIDTSRPHPARMYDYFLGGKDNYAVDQQAAREILRAVPEVRAMAGRTGRSCNGPSGSWSVRPGQVISRRVVLRPADRDAYGPALSERKLPVSCQL